MTHTKESLTALIEETIQAHCQVAAGLSRFHKDGELVMSRIELAVEATGEMLEAFDDLLEEIRTLKADAENFAPTIRIVDKLQLERDALRAKLGSTEWVPISREIMEDCESWEMPDWYRGGQLMWVATAVSVFVGTYEWRQGRNPHCFITVDGHYFGFPEVTHIRQFIPVELPT